MIWIEMLDEKHSRVGYDREREVVEPTRLLTELGYQLKTKLSDVDYVFAKD